MSDQNRLLTELAEVKEDRDEWRVLADEHLAKLVDCKKELDAMVEASEAKDSNYAWLEKQLAAVTLERDSLKLDAAIGRVPLSLKDHEYENKIRALEQERDTLQMMVTSDSVDMRELSACKTILAQIRADLDAHDVLPEWLPIIDAAIAEMKEQRT